MNIYKRLDEFRRFQLWFDELPQLNINQKQKKSKTYNVLNTHATWHEGTLGLELLSSPHHTSSYAMLLTKFSPNNTRNFTFNICFGTDVERVGFLSKIANNSDNVYLGVLAEYIPALEKCIEQWYKNNLLPCGELTVINGAYGKIGSSNISFLRTLNTILLLYKNWQELSSEDNLCELILKGCKENLII